MSGSNPPAVVIDDTIVHYNTSRDASQAFAPSNAVINSVTFAKASPWNDTLAVITSPVSIWYNVTGYTRIAVYGALIPPSNLGVTAWANYTVNGNYTAANITTSTHIVTDFPLFTSVKLDPNQQYKLTADIWASPDAPYLFDYLLAFSPPGPTPMSTSGTASSTSSASAAVTATASSSSKDATNIPHPITIIGAIAGGCALLLALLFVTLCCWCRSRGSKPKKIEEPVGPKSAFSPRPSVGGGATLISTKASRCAESFLEPSFRASSSVLAPTAGLSLVPEDPAALSSVPAHAPRPATTYVSEHGQFAGPATHHRSATLPTVQHFPPAAPSAMTTTTREAYQRSMSPQHTLPHAASMPRLGTGSGTPSGMSTPMMLHLPTPFEHPPAGQILRPETPLQNPYDDLYARLDAATPMGAATAPGSGSSTPTLARSRSPAPALSGAVPTHTPASTTTTALGLSISISGPSAPATTTAAPASSSKLRRGPGEYPPEKKEVRLEPPVQRLTSASSPEKEDFADCPPAYSS
ncbi:hypothetical protein V8D89_003388 [Ganoderma adspersum]